MNEIMRPLDLLGAISRDDGFADVACLSEILNVVAVMILRACVLA